MNDKVKENIRLIRKYLLEGYDVTEIDHILLELDELEENLNNE